jgi:hypothetical protein
MREQCAEKIDKSTWGDGPWQTEPDRFEWQHAGYACLLTRSACLGNLCGYVGIDRSHPDYEVPYGDIDEEIDVHGGLTYAAKCQGDICHVPAPGMPDDVWWLGFDCAHAYDLSPGLIAREREMARRNAKLTAMFERVPPGWGETYRDFAYVKAEVESLAEQLAARAVTVSPES